MNEKEWNQSVQEALDKINYWKIFCVLTWFSNYITIRFKKFGIYGLGGDHRGRWESKRNN